MREPPLWLQRGTSEPHRSWGRTPGQTPGQTPRPTHRVRHRSNTRFWAGDCRGGEDSATFAHFLGVNNQGRVSVRQQQVQALYRAALERPAAERAAFIADLTGED